MWSLGLFGAFRGSPVSFVVLSCLKLSDLILRFLKLSDLAFFNPNLSKVV